MCSEEAGASVAHKEAIVGAGFDDTIRTEIYTGRPLWVGDEPVRAIMGAQSEAGDEGAAAEGRDSLHEGLGGDE